MEYVLLLLHPKHKALNDCHQCAHNDYQDHITALLVITSYAWSLIVHE